MHYNVDLKVSRMKSDEKKVSLCKGSPHFPVLGINNKRENIEYCFRFVYVSHEIFHGVGGLNIVLC